MMSMRDLRKTGRSYWSDVRDLGRRGSESMYALGERGLETMRGLRRDRREDAFTTANAVVGGALVATAAAFVGMWLWRRRGRSEPLGHVPGRPKATSTRAMEMGAGLLQGKSPMSAFSTYINAIHFYVDDTGRQIETHTYCAQLNEDVMQCAVFDANTSDARLIGVEYIVSERLFKTLPDDEKKLWHSHAHEVKSGNAIAPGMPPFAEREFMKKLAPTYGKLFSTWDLQRGNLPLGIPQLMAADTRDGQIRPEMFMARDRRFGVSTERIRQRRADLATPSVVPGADAWESGEAVHLEIAGRGERIGQSGTV